MVILSENDYLDVKLNSLIADYDYETLSNLYQPIIGYAALSIYFSLVSEARNQKITSLISHNQLLNRLQMANSSFVDGRKRLEAVGLLKTFLEQKGKIRIYHYRLFSPKTPSAFFDDVLLHGYLIKALGETDTNRFKAIYSFFPDDNIGDDISDSFNEVYKPNFDDSAFTKALGRVSCVSRNGAKINSGFDYDKFFIALSEVSQIQKIAFTKKDLKEIDRLATLNSISEKEAAIIISSIYEPFAEKGKHIDYNLLAKKFQQQLLFENKDSKEKPVEHANALGEKINLLENCSPKYYLSILQGGKPAATTDLMTVNEISKKFNLPNGVINVLVEYVLSINNNVLSNLMCEKYAASLSREGIEDAQSAMNFFIKIKKKQNNYLKKQSASSESYEMSKADVERKKQLNDLMNEMNVITKNRRK